MGTSFWTPYLKGRQIIAQGKRRRSVALGNGRKRIIVREIVLKNALAFFRTKWKSPFSKQNYCNRYF